MSSAPRCEQNQIGVKCPVAIPWISAFFITSLFVFLSCAGCVGLSNKTPSQLPAARVGVPYTTTLRASGGGTHYHWTLVSGAPPPGVSLNAGTGTLSGTPTQTGSFKFTFNLSDSSGPTPEIRASSVSLNVDPPAPQITTSILSNAQAGVQFQANLAATGGVQPYHWSLVSGTLPSGLSLNRGTGLLSGITSLGGQFDFSVQVSDSSSPSPQTAMKALTLSVLAFALQINSGGLPNGQVGTLYQASVSGSGGVAPYTWIVVGSLPAGLGLNAASGSITGTPTQAGTSTFMIQVTDSTQQSAKTSVNATIAPAGVQPLSISTTTLSEQTVGQAYSATLQATGGALPYTWTIQSGQLPTGLSLSTAGKITGTPSATGQSSFTVQVSDSATPALTASKAFSIAALAAASLDQYGGDANHTCAGAMKNGSPIQGATGFFYLYKDTNLKHWMFCDPLGNRFWMTSVQVVDYGGQNYQNIVNAKYDPCCGSARGWAAIQSLRLQAMGFNTIGEFQNGHMLPVAGENPNKMPSIVLANPGHYVFRDSSTPIKDIFANLPPQWNIVDGYRGFSTADFEDPVWVPFVNGGTHLPGVYPGNSYIMIAAEDDVDFVRLKGQFTWFIATTAPYEQFEHSYGSGYPAHVFADPIMHAKSAWSTWLCGTHYTNLAALNTAWGSSYTTCGSSATNSGTEIIGTGDGSNTSFSYSFAHGPVDPASIGISVGGMLQAGDCPWFNQICPGPISTGTPQAATGNVNGGAISYNSGGAACAGRAAPCVTVTFSAAPASGVAITATYQYGGWPKATAGGTGLMDEDGTSAWWPAGDPLSFTSFPDPPVTIITTDMDVFLNLFSIRYFKPLHDAMKAQNPNMLVSGLDAMQPGVFRNQVMAAAAANIDVFNLTYDPQTSANMTSVNNFYKAYGTPGYVTIYMDSSPDSQFSASPCNYGGTACFLTQNAKGVGYQSKLSIEFNQSGTDGYGFIVGDDYWQYTDNSGEHGAYGLVSLNDNLYDGIESCGKSIVDPWGFTTIPEPTTGCYGDFITPVTAANRIWLGLQ